ncbi:hypothetical protein GOQ30_05360 [Flavobacterium sp. TP390]|uniref:Uncharacterized protein n=1 Tax=Flavobacterium profundi TaxID=1774945 RepID=A0A6I4IK67_9FLAO|nr:hypothetical protein [Flavobacterium profundi]MVO08589.1 hypothetical protein [Flavobacterium profundi]
MRTVEEIRANYKKFTDSKIEDLAKYESKSLRRDVLSVLKDEIIARNLDPNLITWVDAENDSLSEMEKKNLKQRIKHLPCPTCFKKNGEIYGYEITTVISFLIYCNDVTEFKITCSDCAKKAKSNAILKTLFLGWWSRSGFFVTPATLLKEIVNRLFYKEKISNRVIDNFIATNTGMFRLKGMEKEALLSLLKKLNREKY